jgi:acetyl-CoA synthase
LVWMHKSLKEELGEVINARAAEHGIQNFLEMVADETVATTEEEVLEYLTRVNHPALALPALF